MFKLFKKSNNNNNKIIDGLDIRGIEYDELINIFENSLYKDKFNKDLTTSDAVKIIVEITKENEQSMINFIINNKNKNKKLKDIIKNKADVFISHAWSYNFFDYLNSIKYYKETYYKDKKLYIWTDIVMINQHPNKQKKLPEKFFEIGFHQSIQKIGKVVLLLQPWENPIPLTRSWCIWEIYGANKFKNDVKLDVVILPKEIEKLKKSITTGEGRLGDRIAKIDISKAKSYKKEDQDMILDAIKSIGIQQVQESVLKPIREWLLNVTKEFAKYEIENEKKKSILYIKLANCAGVIKSLDVDYKLAEEYYKKSIQIFIEEFNENDGEISVLYTNLGNLYKYFNVTEKFGEALNLFKKSLKLNTKDKYYSQMLLDNADIAGIYLLQSNYNDALKYLLETEKLCNDHKIRGPLYSTYQSIGLCKVGLKDFNEAEKYARKAVELGSDRFSGEIIAAYSVLLYCLQCLNKDDNKYEQEITTTKNLVADYKKAYPVVEMIAKNQLMIGKLVIEQNIIDKNEARYYLDSAKEAFIKLKGENHHETVEVQNLLDTLS